MRLSLPIWIALVMASPALAHPHMFMDTGVDVIFDDRGRATGIKVAWVYDELTSLQYIADLGLDADGDNKLTADERAKLSGFDMGWDAGFAGDTYALLGDMPLALSRPRDWTADYVGGRITSTHLRDFTAPIGDLGEKTLTVQVYDPGFYAAYTMVAGDVRGPDGTAVAGCAAELFAPDRTEADAVLMAALAEYTPDQDLESDFPAIGAAYAEEVRVTCAPH